MQKKAHVKFDKLDWDYLAHTYALSHLKPVTCRISNIAQESNSCSEIKVSCALALMYYAGRVCVVYEI